MYFLMQGTPYIYMGQELGMTNTHFANAHGFHDDNHYTTAASKLQSDSCVGMFSCSLQAHIRRKTAPSFIF